MLKPILASLMAFTMVEAAPFNVSQQTSLEISRLIPDDEMPRFKDIYEKVCDVKATLVSTELSQRDCDILALQASLSYGKTGPEIVQQLRQSAIKQWNKQQASPIVKQAVLKMLTYGIRPTNGYAAHYFERDYLYDLSFEERTKTKKEFEQAMTTFWPTMTKQLKHEWLKRLPTYEAVDAAAFEAGLNHEAALDIYSALLGHHIYGWIVSGFGGDESTFKEIPMPPEFDIQLHSTRRELLQLLYTETSQLENKWHYRINDRNYHSSQPNYFAINEIQQYQGDASKMARALEHLPTDIRPEIVVMSAYAYTENLSKTIGQVYTFSPKANHSLLGITERLFNQDILTDQRRFVGIRLGRQFYHQIQRVADRLGMVPVVQSEEVVGFRRAQVPERTALIHVAAIRNTLELSHLIATHAELPITTIVAETIMSWSNSPYNTDWVSNPSDILAKLATSALPTAPTATKAEIKTVADLGRYVTVIDNTILAQPFARKQLTDLRYQLVFLSFHPKAESVNFDINPEFRSSLEKIFSGATMNEFQSALLSDHLMRLEQLVDRQIGYDPYIIAHSAYYREKFMTEVWPHLTPSSIPQGPLGTLPKDNPFYKSYASMRQFLADGQRVFRRLQQLEIEVMTKTNEMNKAPELVLQDVLLQWEHENGFDHSVDHRLQWNLVMREMKDHPELYGNLSTGDLYREIGNSTTDCVKRVVRDCVPGLGNIEHYK